jgi:hypothetical protein
MSDRERSLIAKTRVAAYLEDECTAPVVAALLLAGADLDDAVAYAAWMQRRMIAHWRAGRVVVS